MYRKTRFFTLIGMAIWACLGLALQAQAQGGRYLIHTATAANTIGHVTYINDPATNGAPVRMLMVTQDWSGVGVYNNHHIGVWYNGFLRRWAIFNQDLAPMPLNATFFVYVSNPGFGVFTHVASAANIRVQVTYINNAATNGHPERKLFVTPKFMGVYQNHAIGVWYDGARRMWAIFNQDNAPMSRGSAFNVFVLLPGRSNVPVAGGTLLKDVHTHIATAANSAADFTVLDSAGPLPRWNAWVFSTASYNPFGVFNNHSTGVWYTGRYWSVFNEDLAPIRPGAAFNVWIRAIH